VPLERKKELLVMQPTRVIEKTCRTDQIGSLIRPTALLDARDAFRSGAIDRQNLHQIEDEAILGALELQRNAGVQIFSDGEFRRDGYQTGISEAVEGFAADYLVQEDKRPDGTVVRKVHHSKPVCGKLRPRARLAGTDAEFLGKHAPGPFKITLVSPALVAFRSYKVGVTDKYYPEPDMLLDDLVLIVSDEMKALVAQGVPYIQLDMGFARYALDDTHAKAAVEGIDLELQLQKDIDAENRCYEKAKASGVVFGMHVCRGNRNVFNQAKGSYEWLAERLFSELAVDRFLLEYDSIRAGGFEPLRHLPKDKIAVLGLVSSKNAALESQDDLVRRVDEASSFCSYDQLALSAQCGFHGAADRDAAHMSMDNQRRKLELIAETARRIWS
jgi:5-methyltetrahydropteroyltriglutamate--homocysteine methyltransferase